MILEQVTTPLLDVIRSKVFCLGGPEYGERFSFANPGDVYKDIRNGHTPPMT
jgi:hypothetical protein